MNEYREVRVRPVIRYIVTAYVDDGKGKASSSGLGEFESAQTANKVGFAIWREAFMDGPDHQGPRLFNPMHSLRLARRQTADGDPEAWELIDEGVPK